MKILILHASAGAGHKRAAEALGKAFADRDKSLEVKVYDILDATGAVFKKTYGKGYLDLVRKAPELWGYMFSQSDKKALDPWRKKVRAVFNEINTLRFRNFCDDYRPDIAVCTHFMPLELLSRKTGRYRKEQAPLYGIVTDFAVHSLWLVQNVACYYVATEEARRQIIRKGQPPDGVKVTGIPIDPVFAVSEEPGPVKKRLGLFPDMPTVLMLSGGFGVGPTVDLIRSLHQMEKPCQFLVVAGANEKMKAEAEAAARGVKARVRVFGFVNNVHELMDASDIVISKPGGLTTSEVLAKGKAMIVIDPIPGQEQRNCEFLLEAGAAVRLYEPEEASYKIQALLSDPARLARMGQSAKAIGKPHAARDIVRDILRS